MATNYEDIMREITSGLTGESTTDKAYLMNKAEEYKTHQLAQEVMRGIGRLMYEVMPPEYREGWEKLLENEQQGVDAVIEEAKFQAYQKKFDKSLKILVSRDVLKCASSH